tara:strand:- start:1654 stop:1815 length:162 start_codon:yes stop_codon:yes gene_type:complete
MKRTRDKLLFTKYLLREIEVCYKVLQEIANCSDQANPMYLRKIAKEQLRKRKY